MLKKLMIATLLLCAISAEARRPSSGGSVPVRGYVRKDGTYVAPHMRSAPNETKSDNWSTKDNLNPYTLDYGTRNLYPVDNQQQSN